MDPIMQSAVADVIAEVENEVGRAVHLHGRYASLHEAYGVLMEEVCEYADEVFKKRAMRDLGNVRSELVQIAAVAIKAAVCFTGAAARPSSKLMSERTAPGEPIGDGFDPGPLSSSRKPAWSEGQVFKLSRPRTDEEAAQRWTVRVGEVVAQPLGSHRVTRHYTSLPFFEDAIRAGEVVEADAALPSRSIARRVAVEQGGPMPTHAQESAT